MVQPDPTFLLLPGYNGERLRAKVTKKEVEDIEQADGERVVQLHWSYPCFR